MAKAAEKTPAKIAFGDRLQEAIAASGYKSDAAFARKIGISPKRMSNFINGWRWAEPELLGAICEQLDCTADYLLFGKRAGLLGDFRDRLDAWRAAGKLSGRT
jgi:plasmid maintenance system antidote protein VapI